MKDNLNCFRLPIVQGGGSLAFVGPTFSILSLPQWKCPDLSGKLTSMKSYLHSWSLKPCWISSMQEIQENKS